MSSRPNRSIGVVVKEFKTAWINNDSASIATAEKELDNIVRKRLRRLSYANYPKEEIENLLAILPEEYAKSDIVYDVLMKRSG